MTLDYEVSYDVAGAIDLSPDSFHDWIAVGGEALYPPLNLMEVVETKWQGHNPYVTEQNVRRST